MSDVTEEDGGLVYSRRQPPAAGKDQDDAVPAMTLWGSFRVMGEAAMFV